MNPIQTFKITVTGIALLLTACAPVALASTPPAAPTPTDAEVAMVDATDSTPPTAVPAAKEAPTTVALAAAANTAQNSDVASSVAAAALAQPQGPAYENLNSPVDLLASY